MPCSRSAIIGTRLQRARLGGEPIAPPPFDPPQNDPNPAQIAAMSAWYLAQMVSASVFGMRGKVPVAPAARVDAER